MEVAQQFHSYNENHAPNSDSFSFEREICSIMSEGESNTSTNLIVLEIPPKMEWIGESVWGTRPICNPSHMDQLRAIDLTRDGQDHVWILTPPNMDDRICSQGTTSDDVDQPIDEDMLESDYEDQWEEACNYVL